MHIRTASMADLAAVTAMEAACFPAAEAATAQDFAARLAVYPNHFWLMEDDNGTLVSFVNGLVTDEPHLRDEMYADAGFHDENGAWQMIFGLDTIPAYRCRGCAGMLLQHAIDESRAQGRRGLVLTCKDHLVHYYARFGFVNEGFTGSTHGGVNWNQMRLTF